MIIRLPVVGEVRTGKDLESELNVERYVQSLSSADKMKVSNLGGLVSDALSRKLSNEKTISSKLLQANKEWVYRNNDVIAKEISQMQFVLYRIDLKGGEIVYSELEDHPLLDLLDRFNGTTTKSDALYVTQSHKKLTGDCFWLLEKNGNTITDIYILPPDKIEVLIGDPGEDLITGYRYVDSIDGRKIDRTYDPDQIIHIKTPNPNNMFRGYGAVEAAAETIDVDNLTNATTRSFFEKGAITNFVLSTEKTLNDEQLKRLKAELRSQYSGARNAYKTMILGGGLKPEKLTFSNKDMEFLAQLEWYRDKLMVIFGNTKASLGIIDDVNRASHESSIIAWKRNSVKPEMQSIVDTLNEFLVPQFGDKLVLAYEDPIPEDREAKLSEVEKAKGILTINERRSLLGYDTVEGGDIIPEVASNERADALAASFRGENKPEDKKSMIPIHLKNVDYRRVLRMNRMYRAKQINQEFKEAAIPLAKAIVKGRKGSKKKEEVTEVREHEQFTNEKIWEYWLKQINVVDNFEGRFKSQVVKYLEFVEKTVLENVDEEVAARKGIRRATIQKQLYEEEQMIIKAELDFTPLLMEEIAIAGNQAMKLIGVDDPYIPLSIRDAVAANVRKFAKSMLHTDQEKLIDIIANGVKEGESVPTIRKKIQEAFVHIKKNQAELVTRTEVLKASNMAAVDAFEQSGVVEAKQWLTAEDDRVDSVLCAPMNGKTIGLRDKFFKKGEEFNGVTFSYESIKWPPLHPGCRCVLLPVLRNQKGFIPAPILEKAILTEKIKQLESQLSDQGKDLKEFKAQKLTDAEYIVVLEKFANSKKQVIDTEAKDNEDTN